MDRNIENEEEVEDPVLERLRDAKDLKGGLQLDLPKLGLLSIPRQALLLRKLRVLNLRANNLSMLPTELCESFHDLQFLNLSSNKLQYVPENISSLSHLRTLLLQNNELVEIPDGVGRLPLLVELRLERNQLESLPDTVGRLSLLKILTMSSNRLTSLPNSMVGMKCLESLDLSDNTELDLDALPDKLFRLHEMYQLLHSKAKRQMVISRAMAIRPAIRQAVKDDMFQSE